MKKKLLPILLACMCTFGLIACGGGKSSDVAVTGVTLSEKSVELMVNEYKTLTATVQPENATNKSITWASDNPTIASVVDGKVTALAEGSAKITVTTVDGNKTATCDVTVKPITYSVVIANKADLSAEWMRGGATRSLSLQITPNGNIDSLITSGAITVTSSNPDAVAASGRNLSAKGAGTSTITVNYGNASDSVEITVTGVTYTPLKDIIDEVLPHKDDATQYVSSEYSVKGTVTAILGTKSYVIQSGSYGLYIYATAPEGTKIGDVVGVNSATFTTYKGLVETKKINGSTEILPEAGETIVPLKLSKLDDLTFDKQNILASIDGISSLGQSTPAIAGQEYRYSYITDGVTTAETYCIYVNKYLSAETISAINDKLDKLEGKEAGKAYKANLKGMLTSVYDYPQFVPQSAEEIELIEQTVVNPTSVTITNTETKLQAGKTLQLTTSFEPADCNVKGLTWTVDDESKATISETGLLSGLAAGNVKVTATSTAVDTVKDEFEIEIFAADYITEPVAGENYYLAIEQEGLGKMLYAKDVKDGYYGATTEDKTEAPYAVLTAGTGENEGKYALKVGEKYYDCSYDGTKYYNFVLADEAAYLSWDAAKSCFYKDFGEVQKYLGTNGTYKTVSWNDESKQTYPARLYPSYEIKLDESKEYIFGMYHPGVTTPGYYFVTGGMDGYYGATTMDVSKAATVKVTLGTGENAGKVAIKVGSSYINVVKSGNYINYGYSGTETFLNWDSFKSAAYADIEGVKYYVGTQGTSKYTTMAAVKEAANLIFGRLFLKPTIPAPTAITVNGADEVNTNETATYTVTVEPTGANPAVTWSVENGTGEATINASGVLTPSKAGTVTVKATSTVDTSVVGSKDVTLVESTGPVKGSKENPYTVAEVIEATKSLESGSYFKDGASVYAKGYINTSFTNKGTWCQNVKLADNYGDATTFLAYNPNFTTTVTEVFVGDQVVIGGPIKNYNGTIEFTNTSDKSVYPTFDSVTHPEYAISVDSKSSENATVDLSANKGTNGTEFTFTVTPAEGYLVEAVTVNGKTVTANEGTYTGTIAGPTKVCVTTKSSSQKEPVLLAGFTMGDAPKGATKHTDGSTISAYTETVGTYTLTLANLSGVYGSACDEKLNGILKLGTSKANGSFDFTVPNDVTIVRIYVAKYKTNASTVTVAGKDYELTKNSNDGEYDVITIDTSLATAKTVTFASGKSGDKRCCINGIDFLKAAE